MPTIASVKIGGNLKRVREDRLMTQADLAEVADLAPSTLVRIENDQVEPRFRTIKKLARALNVEPKELTRREE